MDRSSTNISAHPGMMESAAAAVPIPPTERELVILRRMLGALASEGADALLDQLRMVQVAPSSDETMRIYLVHGDAPRSSCSRDARAKVIALPVRSPAGRVIGEAAVWVDHGHLRALQYVAFDGRPALMLPHPEWIELPQVEPAVPMAVCVRGAREALVGIRILRDSQLAAAAPAAPPHRGVALRRVVAPALVLLLLALALAVFSLGRSGGVDLDAARAAGTAAGAVDGSAHGEIAGSFNAVTEGELAGRASTWQTAHDTARAQTLKQARQAALARRQAAQGAAAAAAAAQAVSVNPSTCLGYRDSRGVWVCT